MVLIECGASHNFISTDLVTKLGIPSINTCNFRVLMGTFQGLMNQVFHDYFCKFVIVFFFF